MNTCQSHGENAQNAPRVRSLWFSTFSTTTLWTATLALVFTPGQ